MKGQISIETVIMIGMLLLLFITVSITVVYRNVQTNIISENYDELNLCKEVSMLVSNSYAQGPKTEIFINANLSMEIIGNEVRVGNNYCQIMGKAADANLAVGKIRIKNATGVVQLENV